MKKLLYILAGLLTIAVVGVIILVLRLDPIVEGFRPEITKKASEALGAKVEIGEIKSSVFPTIGFSLSEIKVGENGTVNADLVSIKSSLMDLLSGKISVEDILVEGVNLPIEKLADGSIQIGEIKLGAKDNAKPAQPEVDASKADTPKPDAPKAAQSAPNLEIKNVGLADINVSYKDPSTKVAIENLGGSIKNIDASGSAELDLSADLFSGKLGIAGVVGNPMAMKPLDFTTTLSGINLHEIPIPPLDGVTVTEQADIRAKVKSAALAFDTEVELNLTNAELGYKELFAKPKGYTLTVDTKALVPVIVSKGSTNVEKLVAKIGSSNIDATAVVGKKPSINIKKANIDLEDLSKVVAQLKELKAVGNVLAVLDVKKANPPSLYGKVTLDSVGVTKVVEISDLKGELDFKDQVITSKDLSLLVAGNKVNIDLRTKSLTPAEATVKVSSDTFDLTAFNFPDSVIKGLVVDADYRQRPDELIADIMLSGGSVKTIPLGKSEVKVVKKANTITAKVAPLGVAEGEITGDASVTLGKELALNFAGSGIQLESLTKAISGEVTALSLKLSGVQNENLVNTLVGPVSLDVGPGEIKGVNILKDVTAALSKIPGVSGSLGIDPELVNAKGTAFDSLKFSSNLNAGKVNIDRVLLNHSLYQVSASGSATMAGSANLKASFSLKAALAESLIAKEPKLKLAQDKNGSIVVPLVIKKTADKTVVLPDVEQLLSRAAKNTAKEAASRKLDKVAPGAGKILDSLF